MQQKEQENKEESQLILCSHGSESLLLHDLSQKLSVVGFIDITEKAQQVKNAFLAIVNILIHDQSKYDYFLAEYKETLKTIILYLDSVKETYSQHKDTSDLH